MKDLRCFMCSKLKKGCAKNGFSGAVLMDYYYCPKGIANPFQFACREIAIKDKYKKIIEH